MGDSTQGSRSERSSDPLQQASEEIRYLKRAIDGDEREGLTGLRQRVTNIEYAIHEAEQERMSLNWRLSMVSGVLRWLGPSGVMLLIGFIAYVIRVGQ